MSRPSTCEAMMRKRVKKFIDDWGGRLDPDEIDALQHTIDRARGNLQTAEHDPYTQGAFDMREYFVACLNKYQIPATTAAIQATAMIGLICGLPLTGHGEGARAAVGATIHVLAHYMSIVESENRTFSQGMKDSLGVDVGENHYDMSDGIDLREAIVAYYSGEDKHGELFAAFLRDMPIAQMLLEMKAEFKPGAKTDLDGLLMDQLIARASGKNWHDKTIRVKNQLTDLEEHDAMDNLPDSERLRAVLKRIKEMDQSKIPGIVRKRQHKLNQRGRRL